MLGKYRAGLTRIVDVAGGFAAVLMFAIAMLTVFEVIMRYLFNSPTKWSLEITVAMLIWLAFIGMCYVQRGGKHVAVDLVTTSFSKRTQSWLSLAMLTLYIVAAGYVVCSSLVVVAEAIEYQEGSLGLWRYPVWPIKLAVPVGAFLLLMWLLLEFGESVLSHFKRKADSAGSIRELVLVLTGFAASVGLSCFLLLGVSPIAGMVILMITLLFAGLPVFPSLLLTGVAGVFFTFGGVTNLMGGIPHMVFTGLHDFTLAPLPMFVAAGLIIERSGVATEIYEAATSWVGHIPGGEGIATIIALSVFAAISSSSVATAATIGLIAIPALLALGYNRNLSYGLLAAGGTLGIMIPPSGSMIIYAKVTEESLGKCFMAGIIPGLILAALFAAWVVFYSKRTGKFRVREKIPLRDRFRKSVPAIWGFMVPVIIMGGILSGIFTPLESGAVAVCYALCMALARRRLTLRKLFSTFRESLNATVMVFSIVIGALVLGYFVTIMQLPQLFVDFVLTNQIDRWVVMGAIMLILLIMGCFLEVVSILMITMPVFYPLLIKLGFDGIWLAVVVTLNMEMALITPPVGLNCFVIRGITGAPLSQVLRGTIPFAIIMALGLALFIVVPQLSTWLPSIMITR